MSEKQSSDIERLKKILQNYDDLKKQMENRHISREDILQDQFIQWAVTTSLYNIGEHTNSLSREFTDQYPDIPWARVAGLRHRLVHHYEGTNWSIIVEVIFEDLPDFTAFFEFMLASNSLTHVLKNGGKL